VSPNVYCPIPGISMRRTESGIGVMRIHYTASPRCTPEWVKKERAKYTSQTDWDLEMEINYEAKSGARIYPEFDMNVHVIPHHRIPKVLCRFMAIDPHPRTPHAFLWIGIDQWHDWYVYRELWPSVVCGQPRSLDDNQEDRHFTVREYAEMVAVLEGNRIEWDHAEESDEHGTYTRNGSDSCVSRLYGCGMSALVPSPNCRDHRGPERIIERFMDQAGKGFIASGEHQREENYADRYYRYGIQCSDPIKSHKAGEDSIHEGLKLRKHDMYGVWPTIHISDRCPEMALEFQKARYKPTKSMSPDKELHQDPVEARTHLLDLLRYLRTGRLTWVANLAS
jgi:hypothetical protein